MADFTKGFVKLDAKRRKLDSNPQNLIKHGIDRSVCYGDCGEADMRYPVWTSKLGYDHTNLQKSFLKMAEETNDWRQNEPIQNLIDPELFVLKLEEPAPFYSQYVENVNSQIEKHGYEDDNYIEKHGENWWNMKRREEALAVKGMLSSQAPRLRESYKWLPANIEIQEDGPRFTSHIHNLPKAGNEEMYSDLENLFSKMLPMFRQIEGFKDTNTFQVVVKSQLYHIKDRQGYSGHWHEEGLTENIKGVGVYYYKMDEGLTGGNIKFRNRKIPGGGYRHRVWKKEDDYRREGNIFEIEDAIEVSVAEGDCLVFENSLPHRLRMLKNNMKDGKTRRRGILTFFLISPQKPLEFTTREVGCLNRDQLAEALRQFFDDDNVIADILSFSPFQLYTEEEAKQFRNISINQQIEHKDRFASICFGNSGQTHFISYPDKLVVSGSIIHRSGCINDEYHLLSLTNSVLSNSVKSMEVETQI